MYEPPLPPHTTRTDRDSRAVELEVREGDKVKKPTPPQTPPTRTNRDSRAAVRGFKGARGGRTHKDRLTGAAQDVVSEEADTLVKYRMGLTAEAEVGWQRKKTIDWGNGEKRNTREDRTSSAHSETMP